MTGLSGRLNQPERASDSRPGLTQNRRRTPRLRSLSRPGRPLRPGSPGQLRRAELAAARVSASFGRADTDIRHCNFITVYRSFRLNTSLRETAYVSISASPSVAVLWKTKFPKQRSTDCEGRPSMDEFCERNLCKYPN